jgi:hypothetical protein
MWLDASRTGKVLLDSNSTGKDRIQEINLPPSIATMTNFLAMKLA